MAHENAEAFKLYTQARTLWLTRSQAGMKQSINLSSGDRTG